MHSNKMLNQLEKREALHESLFNIHGNTHIHTKKISLFLSSIRYINTHSLFPAPPADPCPSGPAGGPLKPPAQKKEEIMKKKPLAEEKWPGFEGVGDGGVARGWHVWAKVMGTLL